MTPVIINARGLVHSTIYLVFIMHVMLFMSFITFNYLVKGFWNQPEVWMSLVALGANGQYQHSAVIVLWTIGVRNPGLARNSSACALEIDRKPNQNK